MSDTRDIANKAFAKAEENEGRLNKIEKSFSGLELQLWDQLLLDQQD